ncbi:outer membrane protein assembly factor BamA, partial [bacterium]
TVTVFTFGKVTFSGDSELSLEKLKELSQAREGETFSSKSLRESVWKLEEAHYDLGYAYADVRPMTSVNHEEKTIDLDFVVAMGEKVKIGRIDIHGNTITRDRVIRREFTLAEGEWFSGGAIKNSQRKVTKLGFFESADFDFKKRPNEPVVDVDESIKEQPTGTISAGGGYSTTDGFFGMVSISQRNLFGYGYQLSLNGNFGVEHDTYTLTFNNPRIFDSNVYGGIDLYKSFREYDEYDKKSLGFTVRGGLALDDDWSVRVAYTLDSTDMYNVCTQAGYDAGACSSLASVVAQEQEGKRITASVKPSIAYDTRDNQWEATKGVNVKASVELAGGPLGHDSEYVKYEAEAKKYFAMPLDSVFTVEGHGGLLRGIEGKPIPIYERFALGGMYSVRGFGWRDIGPKDAATGEVIGGDKYLQFNAEYLYPLVKEAKLKMVLFFDSGNAWDVGQDYFETPMRISTGIGFRWFSPLGPLRLEYGHILDKKDGEDGSRWDFSIGGFF